MTQKFYACRNSLFHALAVGFILTGCSNAPADTQSQRAADNAHIAALPELTTLSPEDEAAIMSVIYDKYLGGQKRSDVEAIREAYHPDSLMMIPVKDEDGRSVLRKTNDMHKEVESWADPGMPDMDLDTYPILSLTAVDNRMAQILLKSQDRVFDAITMVKIDGKWVIASKVYILQKEE